MRDILVHIFGTGLPKALDVAQAPQQTAGQPGRGALSHRLIAEIQDKASLTNAQIDARPD
ncbi:hypothetical protein KH5H1_02260 [Corallococcus caeni]|nr:hypothetical protein KH5H1_02260 [Corallococcus sp. KH5-1]